VAKLIGTIVVGVTVGEFTTPGVLVGADGDVVLLFFLLHATDNKDKAKITQNTVIKVFFIFFTSFYRYIFLIFYYIINNISETVFVKMKKIGLMWCFIVETRHGVSLHYKTFNVIQIKKGAVVTPSLFCYAKL
jgi:hypothetical protein